MVRPSLKEHIHLIWVILTNKLSLIINLDQITPGMLMGFSKFEKNKFRNKFQKSQLNNIFSMVLVCDKMWWESLGLFVQAVKVISVYTGPNAP